jgi:hypothetical protein
VSTGTEQQILRFAQATCQTHRDALQEALDDLDSRGLTPDDLDRLVKADRRLLDQFAYRYTRLQDDMGAKLMPAILRSLGEDVAAMSVLDRMNRLEQLGWLPSADEWSELRRIRNEFTHDYPESSTERHQRLVLTLTAARRIVEIFHAIERMIRTRFPD